VSELKARLTLRRGADFRLAVDTRIPLDRVTAIYGPSGCGKTSLLGCLAGLLPGDAGSEVLFRDQPWQRDGLFLPAHQRNIAYVFQEARLFPHLDVAGNLAFAEKRRRSGRGPGRDEVCRWLGLADLVQRRPDELSRGQQQRVAIARALLSGADILLLDEPLANLDPASRSEILGHLTVLARELGTPMLYVSHDMEELSRIADRLLVMEAGELVAEGPMLELSSELRLSLAHEENAAAIVTATVVQQDPDFGLTELNLEGQALFITHIDAEASAAMRLRIPARDISLCLERPQQTSILNVLRAEIDQIEAGTGSRLMVRLRIGGQFLLARLTRKSIDTLALAPGQQVYAQVKSAALLSDNHD